MSIASEITRLGSLRDTIRRKLISAGIISNASAKLSECATAIDGMTVNSKVSKVLNTSTTSVAIPKGYHKEAGTVSISTQEKTQAVTSGTVTVSPDSGKVLKKVTVNGPTSYADTTQFASAITQDDENTYFGVPNAGYYNTGSKIAAKNSNLNAYSISTITAETSGVNFLFALRSYLETKGQKHFKIGSCTLTGTSATGNCYIRDETNGKYIYQSSSAKLPTTEFEIPDGCEKIQIYQLATANASTSEAHNITVKDVQIY